MNIRNFVPTDDEYRAIVDLEHQCQDDSLASVEGFKHFDANSAKDHWHERLVVEVDGCVVGAAFISLAHWVDEDDYYVIHYQLRSDIEDRYSLQVIHKECQRRVLARGAKKVGTLARGDQPDRIAMLERDGYSLVQTQYNSRLDLNQYEGADLDARVSALQQAGIQFMDAAALSSQDPQFRPKLYELLNEIEKDVPSQHEHAQPAFAFWERNWFENPVHRDDALLVALDGGRYVGVTRSMAVDGDEGRLYTEITGTLRDYRRRGIALALKHLALQSAKTQGFRYVATSNEVENPMFAINQKLGFEELPEQLHFLRALS